jgi:hypothetical protein
VNLRHHNDLMPLDRIGRTPIETGADGGRVFAKLRDDGLLTL